MGREVKRVPLDFDWPLDQVWHGYEDMCVPDGKPIEHPPTGEGWQMWENTSEGSPISPVFESPEELARWLDETGASAFGRQTASYEDWLAMIKSGQPALTAVMNLQTREIVSGVSGKGKSTRH